MFERICAAELLQGPVVLTFSIARYGLDLGIETTGCAAGRARAFSVRMSDYLNLSFVKNDKEGASKASPRMHRGTRRCGSSCAFKLELIQPHMAQKPVLRGEVAHSNEVTACLQAQPVQAALSGGGVGGGVAA